MQMRRDGCCDGGGGSRAILPAGCGVVVRLPAVGWASSDGASANRLCSAACSAALVSGALLRRLLLASEVMRAVDEGDMGESLREVADQPSRRRIVFLGEQPDIIAQREQALEQCLGIP